METVVEAEGGRGGESAKRRRKDKAGGKIDDESATTEEISQDAEISEDEEMSEDEEISEEERAKWTDIDRELFQQKPLSEAEEMDDFRRGWEYVWADQYGSFEQETRLSSMFSTHDTNILGAWAETALQVYSIKVEKAKLMWPLHIYGMVAARDCVDHNRNILFDRERDNCQIITENDPYLLLTGPSRAIVLLDPAVFEINLKVKGDQSEDKETLIHQTCYYNSRTGSRSRSCSNKLCKIKLNLLEIRETVQATIMIVQIISGSWPSNFAGQIFCHDGSSPNKVILLDFPNGKNPPMNQDGYLELSRSVVSVHVRNDMTITVSAYSVAGDSKIFVGSGVVSFTARSGSIIERECELEDKCVLKIKVAWSLLAMTSPLIRP